jgi:outer membrane protein OmpA-like peptidoglycan-associated protein
VTFFSVRERAIRRPRLDLHVHFATGSARLDETARRNLDQVAQALHDRRLAGMRFRVAGHTDSVGDLAFNEGLSEQRARAVVRYLTVERGLAVERLEVAHYGERRPLESNDTPEGRRMNRRVEFELIRE